MTTLDIKHAYFAPFHFRIFGGVLILFGLLFPVQQVGFLSLFLVSAGSTLVGLLLITTRYGIQLDPEAKAYCEYIRVLGLKSGRWKAYSSIEKIFINAVKASQTMTTRGNYRTDIRTQEHIAYLKFDDGSKVQLDEDRNKEKLLNRVENYNTLLRTTVADNT